MIEDRPLPLTDDGPVVALAELIDPDREADPSRDAALRRQLRDWIDGNELASVRLMRGRGRSWTEVAEVLGITKQAAHKRFSRQPYVR